MSRPDATAGAPALWSERLQRPIQDVLEGRVRITLAGTEYVLPVLTIGENADWKASLDAELAPIVAHEDDLSTVVELLEGFSAKLLDFIYSYDKAGTLPDRGVWERDIYPHELLRAVMEVRLATDPSSRYALAFSAAVAQTQSRTILDRARSALTSFLQRPTAGRSPGSAPN
jgi:hypothetical protein